MDGRVKFPNLSSGLFVIKDNIFTEAVGSSKMAFIERSILGMLRRRSNIWAIPLVLVDGVQMKRERDPESGEYYFEYCFKLEEPEDYIS